MNFQNVIPKSNTMLREIIDIYQMSIGGTKFSKHSLGSIICKQIGGECTVQKSNAKCDVCFLGLYGQSELRKHK